MPESAVMSVRRMRSTEVSDVVAMMHALWPEERDYAFDDETVFV